MTDRNAIVIGSGANGLAAAIVLAQAGLQVEVREAKAIIGGAASSGPATLPGFTHDYGSAVHAMALSSPFFRTLPLQQFGTRWIFSPIEFAHPLDGGRAAVVLRSVDETARRLDGDGTAYKRLFDPLVPRWHELMSEVLRPLALPHRPWLLLQFGLRASAPYTWLANSLFRNNETRAILAGSAAHSTLDLRAPLSSAFAMILGGSAHGVGWPVAQGGTQSLVNALAAYLRSLGGQIRTNVPVEDLRELQAADLILCDVTPRQFLAMAGRSLSEPFAKLLGRYRYGPGVFKVDYALNEPIPWKAAECREALTVHLGGTMDEIARSEAAAAQGRPPSKPFVLVVQPSLYDPTRAPAGKHVAWAYCHVPNGWTGSALAQIEDQFERFAPGFRDCVLARSARTATDMERWNPNLVGGDINGGSLDVSQFLLRPTWRRYGTPLKGVYLCSSATPPGGSVHGMCGYWAAKRALRSLPR